MSKQHARNQLEQYCREHNKVEVSTEEAIEILRYGTTLPKPRRTETHARSLLWELILADNIRLTSKRNIMIVEHPFD